MGMTLGEIAASIGSGADHSLARWDGALLQGSGWDLSDLDVLTAAGHLLADTDGAHDIGDATNYWRTLFLENQGGRVAQCKGVVSGGPATQYEMFLGGGQWGADQNQGGTFTFKMGDIASSLGTCVNQLILDPGRPDVFAQGTVNDVIFQSYNGIATYGFVSSFGGWNDVEYGLELRRISGVETSGKTLIFDNQIPDTDFRRSIDFRINSVNKLSIETDGEVIVADFLTAPRADITAIQSGSGFGNAGVAALTFTAYSNFFGLNWFDYLTLFSTTTDLGACLGMFPNGTATDSYVNTYNNGNTGATAWLQMGVRGAIAELLVRDFSQPTDVTTLNIGSGGNDFGGFDLTCSTLTAINFLFAGLTEATIKPDTLELNNGATKTQLDWGTSGELGLQVAAADILRLTASQVRCIQDLVMSDGKNVAVNATTGSQIGTATTQKLGFWGATPVVRPAALTAALTQIAHTGPTTPDYSIATPVDSGVGSAWGFSTQDEFETIMSVILNLQTRVDQLESRLQGAGLLA
jgi:hypothetical protein